MSVPVFDELGKQTRELLRSGYAYDRAKVKLIKPMTDFSFEADSYMNLKTLKPGIAALAKFQNENYGKICTKLTSGGPAVLEYNCNGIISENIDFVAGYSVNFIDSFQSLKLATQFHNSTIHTACSLTKDFDRNVDLLGSVVLKLNNFLVGYQRGFDTNTSEITKNNLALVVNHGSTILHLRCIQIPKEFGLSAFYTVNDQLDIALDTKMASSQHMKLWYFAAGFACKLNEEFKLRMKFDKNLQLGTNMQVKLNDSLLLTLAFNLDLLNPKYGQHKVGMGLDVTV